MRSLERNKLKKYIPENILCTLSYIDYQTFPFECEKISDKEMLRMKTIKDRVDFINKKKLKNTSNETKQRLH